MFELMDTYGQQAIIKVIGVGGGGGNAVDYMVTADIDGVEFINANTDSQALKKSGTRTILQLGANLTKGLGCGANPDIGRQAATEDRERIAEVLAGADMVFITAGMGGGTGTGAAPIVAQVAKDMGILTVAVVTKPFPFEGKKRMGIAEQGIAELTQYVDSIITIPNEKLVAVLGKDASLLDAFGKANEVLQNAVQGIAELITRPGLINVDFADVRTVMSEMGMAMMGAAMATGEHRAREAAVAAVSSPLLEDINISGARHSGQHHCRPEHVHRRVRRGGQRREGVRRRRRDGGDRHGDRPGDGRGDAGDGGGHRPRSGQAQADL